jgi:hypothetical protein
VHPQCPCSRASLAELDRIMTRVSGRVSAHVLFLRPPGVPDGWERGTSWDGIARVPGISVHVDEGGREAALFGASTSGQIVVYDADGHLRFSGGITAARGHEGDNPGADAVVAVVQGGTAQAPRTPVFGCSLVEDSNAS